MMVRIDHAARRWPRHATRRGFVVAVAVGALAVGVAACGSDGGGGSSSAGSGGTTSPHVTSSSGATDSPTSGSDSPSTADRVQLAVDPCTLLTLPEMEAAIGPGVEQGGFGEDLLGRCTYSVGGDVGAGVVAISLGDPLLCAAIQRAIDSGGSAQGVVVDVGQGGIVEPDGGIIQFLVGGGCVGISGSAEGESLPQDVLVTLATAAAGRAG